MAAMTSIPSALAPAFAQAQDICRTHARSFYFASHFLPQPKRQHAYAIYAFCRLLDDAADEAESPASVDRFVGLLDACYAGRSGSEELALRAFAHTVECCRIPRTHFDALAEGCRMDFMVKRYETWKDLEQYCYRVAGVVGLIMCCVFEVRHPLAQAHAVAMGNAMQLTNILRDVREDMERGRIYLPLADMDRFKVSARQLAMRRWTLPFANLMKYEIARARSLYRDGANGIGYIANDGSRLTACVMAVLYSGILRAIESMEYDVFRSRAQVSLLGKLRRIPKAMKLCRCEIGDDVPDVFA
jgi:15-cis-phytoene synthase